MRRAAQYSGSSERFRSDPFSKPHGNQNEKNSPSVWASPFRRWQSCGLFGKLEILGFGLSSLDRQHGKMESVCQTFGVIPFYILQNLPLVLTLEPSPYFKDDLFEPTTGVRRRVWRAGVRSVAHAAVSHFHLREGFCAFHNQMKRDSEIPQADDRQY